MYRSGASNGSCWNKVEKLESKEKRQGGNSYGEQEKFSKCVFTRVFFFFEATYIKQKVYSYNEHVNRAVGTIVGAIELRRSHKTRNSVKTAT